MKCGGRKNKKANPTALQEKYLDWKKLGIQKLGNARLELAHAAIIPSPCGTIMYAEIKQYAVLGGKKKRHVITQLKTVSLSLHLLERSLARPKKTKRILCIINIMSVQMNHDHQLNLELFSTACVD